LELILMVLKQIT